MASTKQPVIANLDGETTWEMVRKTGGDAALFVTKIPCGDSFEFFVFMVNSGDMPETAAQEWLQAARQKYGARLYIYINLSVLEETSFSHVEGRLGAFMIKALGYALTTTGLMEQWQQLLLNSKNPGVQGLLQQQGVI